MKSIAIVSIVLTFLFKDPLQETILGVRKEGIPVKSVMTLEDSIVSLYGKYNVKFSHIVIKQNYLETGNFSSAICKENRNICGMKYNKRGFAIGKNRGHAQYLTVEDCVRDYAAWQKIMISSHERFYNKKIKTDEDYYFFLNHLVIAGKVYAYAEDPLYTSKLKLMEGDGGKKK